MKRRRQARVVPLLTSRDGQCPCLCSQSCGFALGSGNPLTRAQVQPPQQLRGSVPGPCTPTSCPVSLGLPWQERVRKWHYNVIRTSKNKLNLPTEGTNTGLQEHTNQALVLCGASTDQNIWVEKTKGLFILFHKHLSLVHDLVQCENRKVFFSPWKKLFHSSQLNRGTCLSFSPCLQ